MIASNTCLHHLYVKFFPGFRHRFQATLSSCAVYLSKVAVVVQCCSTSSPECTRSSMIPVYKYAHSILQSSPPLMGTRPLLDSHVPPFCSFNALRSSPSPPLSLSSFLSPSPILFSMLHLLALSFLSLRSRSVLLHSRWKLPERLHPLHRTVTQFVKNTQGYICNAL